MKYYISLDCGTQSTKVVLYDENFNSVAQHATANEILYPQPCWAELDADAYVTSALNGIKQCLTKSGIDPRDVRAICGDGIICGVVGVDEEGNAITPFIPYLDSRAEKEAKWIKENCEPIWIEESGNSIVEALQPTVIAMWLLKNHEAFKKHGAKIMNNGPYVLSKLAGLKAKDMFIDWSTISGWLIGFNAVEKTWSRKQMDMFGIPMEILPRIVKPWDIVGNLSKEAAEFTGLPQGVPIVAGAGDTMQSFLGCGIVSPGMAADVAGTAAMFGVMVDGINEELSRNSGLYFTTGTLPDTYYYWGYIRTGGLSLQWFRDRVIGRTGDNSFYEEANALSENVPPGSNGTMFFPYLQGGCNEAANATGCFLNMSSATDTGVLWRAILESIAYEYVTFTDKIRNVGVDINNVIFTEGGSKSDVWNQIKSDALSAKGVTLKRKEGATLASALVAAYAVGDISDIKETLAQLLIPDKTYQPNKAHAIYYRNAYYCHQGLLKVQMSDTFNVCSYLRELELDQTMKNQENDNDLARYQEELFKSNPVLNKNS
ncbi:FGGY-family carbohydrate kinase [Dehalobacterium formicoaceticum]|uniref:FGGY family carbohydrate kinase n=1 Tax=Dehalobacterium formicoaceticum TaxID=51515 RepID=A0ABT1Y678_9FIRM|nr:FGGY family carbohydrate kinase [Dehalobacterium formicoaceticum]MCR6546053.1 FGGY family carbohydrate kinase [Dehalobacterium formicoaceticum]